jgi:subtilisin-like proprotein convertase family protein
MNALTKLTAAALVSALAVPASASTIVETGAGFAIEDNTTATSDIVVTANAIIQSLTVSLDITHTYVGDLVFTLSNGSTTVTLLDRPGVPAGTFGNSDNLDGVYTFSDLGSGQISETTGTGLIAPGIYNSANPLSAFAGANTAGTWTLLISDDAGGDLGTLNGWSLDFKAATGAVPEPGTWLMMILGFGLIGAGMRKNAAQTARMRVSYS